MISNVGFWNIKMEKQQDLQAVIGVMPYFITSLIRTFEMQ
jgi:hypothetical protein